ncbi:hypothetical protein BTN49_1838 [Candidatus Enterovibrio escicola]|uniref:Uncharacterized protein n=1 Tax=Candidatus Enterovibrio escicola TaxID=1927127 RepID=A0A2A5T386_9GAMM|nr:hypothetical protein BTN49_1838 [Candidatus Enterovibrio escacola]
MRYRPDLINNFPTYTTWIGNGIITLMDRKIKIPIHQLKG